MKSLIHQYPSADLQNIVAGNHVYSVEMTYWQHRLMFCSVVFRRLKGRRRGSEVSLAIEERRYKEASSRCCFWVVSYTDASSLRSLRSWSTSSRGTQHCSIAGLASVALSLGSPTQRILALSSLSPREAREVAIT